MCFIVALNGSVNWAWSPSGNAESTKIGVEDHEGDLAYDTEEGPRDG